MERMSVELVTSRLGWGTRHAAQKNVACRRQGGRRQAVGCAYEDRPGAVQWAG